MRSLKKKQKKIMERMIIMMVSKKERAIQVMKQRIWSIKCKNKLSPF